jgi:hypothetical protein
VLTPSQKSKTPVAIKAVSRQKLTSKLLDNLESEINILKAISHRNIVALTDCFVSSFSSPVPTSHLPSSLTFAPLLVPSPRTGFVLITANLSVYLSPRSPPSHFTIWNTEK